MSDSPGQRNSRAAAAFSFRDPSGRVVSCHGRIFRIVKAEGISDFEAFLRSRSAAAFLASGRMVSSRRIDVAWIQTLEGASACLPDDLHGIAAVEHEKIPFASFPHEWPPEMLHSAAELTLDLAAQILPDGFGLKDATPYNVLFRGPSAVFVDLLSFETRDPGDPIWLPYAQFVRTFLLPLLANKYFNIRLDQVFMTSREGLEPETVYGWLRPLQKIRPPFVNLVSGPRWLNSIGTSGNNNIYRKRSLASHEKASFILGSLLNRLRRSLNTLRPAPGKSTWSDYMPGMTHYSEQELAAKADFVQAALRESAVKRVLDIGCNTGYFSRIAAESGATVVAVDRDPAVVGATWRMAVTGKLDILPLVVNLASPSPSLGWRNLECASFLDRARGHFDAVLMLALIHHLIVTERIPLAEIVDLAAELTTNLLLIEFIEPEDVMFKRLLRGREELHRDLSHKTFETECRRKFEILRTHHADGATRWLYLLQRKPCACLASSNLRDFAPSR